MTYLIETRGFDFVVTADVTTKERYHARGQIVGEKVYTYDYLDGFDVVDFVVYSIEWTNANTVTKEVTYSKYPRLHDEILLRLVEHVEEPQ